MQGLAVVLFPVLLMLFALAMERVEFRLSRITLPEQEVQEFLDHASKAEADARSDGGLAHFHLRDDLAEDPLATPATDRELSARRAS